MPEKVTQQFQFTEDKKHSVIYKPVPVPNVKPLASSIYIMRDVLPSPTPRIVHVTLDFTQPSS